MPSWDHPPRFSRRDLRWQVGFPGGWAVLAAFDPGRWGVLARRGPRRAMWSARRRIARDPGITPIERAPRQSGDGRLRGRNGRVDRVVHRRGPAHRRGARDLGAGGRDGPGPGRPARGGPPGADPGRDVPVVRARVGTPGRRTAMLALRLALGRGPARLSLGPKPILSHLRRQVERYHRVGLLSSALRDRLFQALEAEPSPSPPSLPSGHAPVVTTVGLDRSAGIVFIGATPAEGKPATAPDEAIVPALDVPDLRASNRTLRTMHLHRS